jgi:hypothetical protein
MARAHSASPRINTPRSLSLLKYDSIQAARQLRPVRRVLVVLLLLLAGGKLLLMHCGDRLWRTALALLWQHRCMTYQLPEDRIVYVAAPGRQNLPDYLADFSASSGWTWRGTIGASPFPIELAELRTQMNPQNATPWESLPGPVFLHGLQDSQNQTRMVTVHALANNPAGWWTLCATVRDPIRFGVDPRVAAAKPIVSVACWPISPAADDTLIVFAGQADSSNASRFTIRVRLNGQDQTITGVLRDDGKILFTSSSGLQPWGLKRAGTLTLPPINAAPMSDDSTLPADWN